MIPSCADGVALTRGCFLGRSLDVRLWLSGAKGSSSSSRLRFTAGISAEVGVEEEVDMLDRESRPTPAARDLESREKKPVVWGTEAFGYDIGGVCAFALVALLGMLAFLLDDSGVLFTVEVAPSVCRRPGITTTGPELLR